MSPYYQHNGITVYHGDCKAILPELQNITVIVSDPPYGTQLDTDYTRFKGGVQRNRVYKPVIGDSDLFDPQHLLKYKKVLLFGYSYFAQKVPPGTLLIWDKRFKNGSAFLADGEVAWMKNWYNRIGPKTGGRGLYIFSLTQQGFVRPEKDRFHPTQKPVALMEWCIQKLRLEHRDVICDPYMGSGSTLVAAQNLGFQAIGIDVEQEYCDVAVERLRQVSLFGVGSLANNAMNADPKERGAKLAV